jgi:putative flippase GtrA
LETETPIKMNKLSFLKEQKQQSFNKNRKRLVKTFENQDICKTILILLKKAINLIKKRKSLLAYFFAAGSGVIVQYLVGTSYCIGRLGMTPTAGYSIGFIVSFPVGFILSKIFAFNSRKSGNTKREMLKFSIVLIFSYLITVYGALLSLNVLTAFFGDFKMQIPFKSKEFSPVGTISHFAGMGFSFIFNYFTHKKFTFVETGLFDKIKDYKNSRV